MSRTCLLALSALLCSACSGSQSQTTTGRRTAAGSTGSGAGTSSTGTGGVTSSGGSTGATTTAGSSSSSGTTGTACVGAVVRVDDVIGQDLACCGAGSLPQLPCATISRAMSNIAASGQNGVIIDVAHDEDGGVWAPRSSESLPIRLYQSVTLHAPNITFAPLADAGGYFLTSQASDAGAVTLEGDPGQPVRIGFVENGGSPDDSQTRASPLVVQGATVLQNAELAAARNGGIAAIDVNGGVLVLGPGPVTIGGAASGLAGDVGIHCAGAGTAVRDVGGDAGVLSISGQGLMSFGGAGLVTGAGCSVSLTAAPVFGAPPGAGGCKKVDGSGVQVVGAQGDTIDLENGTVQCITGDGIGIAAASGAGPAVTLVAMSVVHAGCGGLSLYSGGAGTVDAEGCTLRDNHWGVQVASGALVIDGGTVVCSTNAEPGNCSGGAGPPGADLYESAGSTPLVAVDVTLDLDGGPVTPFVCAGGGCMVGGWTNGTPVVEWVDGGVSVSGAISYTGACP